MDRRPALLCEPRAQKSSLDTFEPHCYLQNYMMIQSTYANTQHGEKPWLCSFVRGQSIVGGTAYNLDPAEGLV